MPLNELVFSVSYIGDLVTAASVLPLLEVPPTGISLVAAPAAAPLLAGDDRVSRVRVVSSSHAMGWRAQVLWQLLGARRPARVLNLEVYVPRWRFLVSACRLLSLPARHLELPALLADNHRSAVGEPTGRPHRSDYYAVAASAEPPAPLPRLSVDTRLADECLRRLVTHERDGARWLLIHPGSSDLARRAPLDLLAALASGLGRRPILVGSPAEAGLAQALLQRLPPHTRAIDASGRLDLRELAALTSQADLFIGGDSGPLKIAEAVGARTLSFWHRGQPSAAFAGPRGPGHATLPATASAAEALAAASQLLAR